MMRELTQPTRMQMLKMLWWCRCKEVADFQVIQSEAAGPADILGRKCKVKSGHMLPYAVALNGKSSIRSSDRRAE